MTAALFAVPAARALFRRAFMQSGSASRVFDRASAAERAQEFLTAAGVAAGDLAALEALPPEAILDAQERILARDLGQRNAPGGRALGIVADGVTVPEHPIEAFASGLCRDKPVVFGTVRNEARYWFSLGAMILPATADDVIAEMDAFFPGMDGGLPRTTCGPSRAGWPTAAWRASASSS